MNYELVFKKEAKKEWDKLDSGIKESFKKVLRKRLENPHVDSSKLRGMKDCYKIKLLRVGYRLVYQVRNNELVVVVIAVGKRDKNLIYKISKKRV